ncbi:MAG: hypothetical protein JWO41_941 [Candidatus Saccharibacteria bacterium]|nr:hypothetical protein [Candidatus Saccharibacteria bacterium]
MAHVIESREPVVIDDRDEHVHMVEDRGSNTGVIIAVVVLLLLLLLLFGGSRLFGGGGGGSTNVTVPTPSTSTGK